MSAYLVLFAEFFKIGLFAIGGGLATLPFLYELAGRVDWLSPEDIAGMLAVVRLLPGGIGVNLAAYAGSGIAPAGAYIAVLGMVTPQIITISVIASALDSFDRSPLVKRVFAGLLPAAAGLLASAAAGVTRTSVNSARDFFITAFFLALIRVLPKAHPGIFIAAGACAGIFLGL